MLKRRVFLLVICILTVGVVSAGLGAIVHNAFGTLVPRDEFVGAWQQGTAGSGGVLNATLVQQFSGFSNAKNGTTVGASTELTVIRRPTAVSNWEIYE